VTLFSVCAPDRCGRCGNAHAPAARIPKVAAMDSAAVRPQRGHPMSRYIATALLAIAAAAITSTDLAFTFEHPDSAWMVRP
jgi:hypothetical protein